MVTVTEKQLQDLLERKTKGFVTQVTKIAEKTLKQNIETNLYGEKHTNTKSNAYRNVYRDHNFKKSVSREPTTRSGGGYTGEVIFDQSVLQQASEPKTGDYLGRYTDFFGNYVGDELISNGWLEDGTVNEARPNLSRTGAGFIEKTIDDLEDFIIQNELEAYFEGDFDGIRVVK